jgi:hypothetical protein
MVIHEDIEKLYSLSYLKERKNNPPFGYLAV